MKYISTRGGAPVLGFCDAVMTGLARDGGLYVPQAWPTLSGAKIAGLAGKPFADVAFEVIAPFVDGEIPDDILREIVGAAYAGFSHEAVTPLVQLAPNHFVLELFHGPSLAFKDVAMQFLAPVIDHILGRAGRRATIIGATSGDTGSAAIEAFRGRDNIDIFILHPKGRTSEIQRRQMTTVLDPNVYNIAIEGNFDDCQNLVKALFNDLQFRDEVALSGVNSINWGRIVAQITYYFVAAVALGGPARAPLFCVPTGNFGDIFAGYCAHRMGLPLSGLVIATNENDILRRALETGRYQVDTVIPTTSPSMDIQISSNFERLLFEAADREAAVVERQMAALKQSGSFDLTPAQREFIAQIFTAATATRVQVAETQKNTLAATGCLLDPHTAVAATIAGQTNAPQHPIVTLATADPAKFPDAVMAATGVRPALPPQLADLTSRQERVNVLANEVGEVEQFILAHTRATKE
ncbi:MAG: threonine synthase [Alphaproteobacteria bacterium]|nr:threonine synthase [Alphaproteobacteria bacterium]